MNSREQARAAAEAFWDCCGNDSDAALQPIRTLTATALDRDSDLARFGTGLLFREIVEPLNDAFFEPYCRIYEEAFAEVIHFCRAHPLCREFDEELHRAGLHTAADLVRGSVRVRCAAAASSPAQRARVRKVIVPSRITVGADVEVTSLILDHAAEMFSEAEIVFLAPPKSRPLVAGHARLTHRAAAYQRHGILSERLNAWVDTRAIVQHEIQQRAPDEYLVIDPDSRLTQLGLLPLASPERTVFFPSRSYAPPGLSSLAELTASWLGETLGGACEPFPRVWPAEQDRCWAAALRIALAAAEESPLASVNFGVGGNERKRITPEFECNLVRGLVASGMRVLLARGVGEDELASTRKLSDDLTRLGIRVLHLPPGTGAPRLDGTEPDVVTWEGDLGALCGTISASDLYVGYDSAGQHIAAALDVPVVSLFVAASGSRHLERWTPRGRAGVHVITVDPADQHQERLLYDVLAASGRSLPASLRRES